MMSCRWRLTSMGFKELQCLLKLRLESYTPQLIGDTDVFSRPAASLQTPANIQFDAAVLVALLDVNAEPSILLTKRAEHLRIHPGEIAFPGGKMDDADEHLLATALREAEEEVALPVELFHPLGVLDQRVTRSNLRVTPWVGYLAQQPALSANPDEIAEIFTAPLSFFSTPKNLTWDYVIYRGKPRYVAYYQYREYRVWGMTAMVIVNLMNVLFDAGLYPPTLEETQ